MRDLALSNFNKNYVAIDVHIARIITRLGLLNYGFDLLANPDLEMGNNPLNSKQYLFMHRLILKLSAQVGMSASDFDRAFWHFGRSVCKVKPNCSHCSIEYCPSDKHIQKSIYT